MNEYELVNVDVTEVDDNISNRTFYLKNKEELKKLVEDIRQNADILLTYFYNFDESEYLDTTEDDFDINDYNAAQMSEFFLGENLKTRIEDGSISLKIMVRQ